MLISERMLYDYHHKQNAKKLGSVHATYLVDGVKSLEGASQLNGTKSDGEDTPMQSSPFMSSSAPQQGAEHEVDHLRCVTLTREEDLDGKVVFG